MAFLLNKEMDTGVVANYWAIQRGEGRIDSQDLQIVIGLWLDKDAFDAHKEPILTKEIYVEGGLAALDVAAFTYALEQMVRAKPEFQGATDA